MLLHPLPRGGKRKWGQFSGLSVGKYQLALADLLNHWRGGLMKMNRYFKIS